METKIVKGHCMKCKIEVEIKDPKRSVMKNIMRAVKITGVCPICGTPLVKITSK